MAFRFHLACMVFFRRVVCQLSVLAFERSSGGKTERRAAARRTRAPRTADRRRECPRGRPASSGGRVSAHRPQTEKFTVCAHRARGCWVGDDPPSDASLALCARLMSSRGGVGGVDGDGRDRRSTRPEHWRHQPRCQREKVRYSLRERPSNRGELFNEPAKSSIGQRHKDADCLPTRDKCFSDPRPEPILGEADSSRPTKHGRTTLDARALETFSTEACMGCSSSKTAVTPAKVRVDREATPLTPPAACVGLSV